MPEEELALSSEATTQGVHVQVWSRYSAEHSDPQRSNWFFLYTIRIANVGNQTVQLLTRQWTITDATGRVEQVQGPGVVGEQPILQPGGTFLYTSAAMIETPVGTMTGSYEMVADDGVRFDAEIPAFKLSAPNLLH